MPGYCQLSQLVAHVFVVVGWCVVMGVFYHQVGQFGAEGRDFYHPRPIKSVCVHWTLKWTRHSFRFFDFLDFYFCPGSFPARQITHWDWATPPFWASHKFGAHMCAGNLFSSCSKIAADSRPILVKSIVYTFLFFRGGGDRTENRKKKLLTNWLTDWLRTICGQKARQTVGGCPGGVAGPKTLSSQATIDHKNKTNTQRYKMYKKSKINIG